MTLQFNVPAGKYTGYLTGDLKISNSDGTFTEIKSANITAFLEPTLNNLVHIKPQSGTFTIDTTNGINNINLNFFKSRDLVDVESRNRRYINEQKSHDRNKRKKIPEHRNSKRKKN